MSGKALLRAALVLAAVFLAVPAAAQGSYPQGAGGSAGAEGEHTAVDEDGNVYVSGTFRGTASFGGQQLFASGGTDVYVAKYDSFGALVWAVSGGGVSDDTAGGIAIDESQNVYVTGGFRGSAGFGGFSLGSAGQQDGFVAKLNAAGDWQWAVSAGGSQADEALAIVAGPPGVFVGGSCRTTASFGPIAVACSTGAGFVASVDGNGTWLWAHTIGSGASASVHAMTMTSSAQLYVAGSFAAPLTVDLGPPSTPSSVDFEPVSPPDSFLARLSPLNVDGGGSPEPFWNWAEALPGPVAIHAIAVDAFANLHVGGEVTEPGVQIAGLAPLATAGALVARLHDGGFTFQWQWAEAADGGVVNGIAVDDDGNVLVSGSFGDSGLEILEIGPAPEGGTADLFTRTTGPSYIQLDLAGGRLYWVEATQIWRGNLDGSGAEMIVDAGPDFPTGLAVDPVGGKVYWSVQANNEIERANLDGSSPELARTIDFGGPRTLAVDPAGGKIYWSQQNGSIWSADLVDPPAFANNDLLIAGIVSGSKFALDLPGGKIYFTDENIEGADEIRRANLDGSSQELVLDVGGDSPGDLIVDSGTGVFYWSTQQTVKRANTDGSNVVDVVVADADLRSVTIDLAAQQVYLSKLAVPDPDYVIQRRPLVASIALNDPFGFTFDGSGNLLAGSSSPTTGVIRYEGASGDFELLGPLVEVLDPSPGAQSLDRPSELAFGPGGDLYVTSRNNYSSGVGDFDYVVVYDPVTGAELETIPNSFASGAMDQPEYLAFAPDGGLFVSERNQGVRRWGAAGVECGGVLPLACPSGGGLSQPKGLAFGDDGLLYVASYGSDSILRFDPLTGGLVDAFVPAGTSQLDGPTDIAFGPEGDLYVLSDVTKDVLRYDGTTGAFLGLYIASGDAEMTTPRSIGFGPDGGVFVSDASDEVIRRYSFSPAVATMTLGGIVLESSGNVDVFVARLNGGADPAGVSWEWAVAAGGSDADSASAIAVASSSVYYVVGDFRGESTFGELSLESNGGGLPNVFLARIECNGEWARFHTWVSGVGVPAPGCTPPLVPEVEIPGLSPADSAGYFFWSVEDSTLYAVRPAPEAFVRWRVSSDLADEGRIVQAGEVVLPEDPQIHIAGAPAPLEEGTALTYNAILYSGNEASDNAKVFNAFLPGHSVLLYSAVSSPIHRLQVVETVRWDDPAHRVDEVALIGEEVFDPSHDDPSGRTGYVLGTGDPSLPPTSAYDGVGPDRAYDRQARMGPIIPVNENDRALEDLVVAWYAVNAAGVPWPVRPVRYDPVWPPSPLQIVIASEQGSEVYGQPPFSPGAFPSKRIYDQPNPTQPGFNPNDEHALLAPSNTGSGAEALFALRSDLQGLSDPYALLKFWDEGVEQWAFVVYQVVATGSGFDNLAYPGVAGSRVQAPYPLRLLDPCNESFTIDSVPFWQDYQGSVWARAAGSLTVHYFYPLRAEFHYDPDGDGSEDAMEGECVPWLDLLPGGTPGEPFPVDYTIDWPDSVPTLLVGETLLSAKRGLPNIVNQAASEVVFDELSPETPDPAASLAQLIDPLSPRSVSLDALPSDVATIADQGKQRIVGNASGSLKLSSSLSARLLYDPLGDLLSFEGVVDESGAGEPLLLLNVMTADERDAIQDLSGDPDFDAAVAALYQITRNPRELDLDGMEGPDPDLLVGLRDIVVDAQGELVLDEEGEPARDGVPESLAILGAPGALTAGAAAGTGYLTLAFNNDPSLTPLPVSLSVIRVGCAGAGTCSVTTAQACSFDGECPDGESCQLSIGPSPYQGEVKVIEPENVFDEQLTLRHSGDFGGDPSGLSFEWFTQPDTTGTPPPPPSDPDGGVLDGWTRLFTPTPGLVEVTIGGSNLQALSDNWYFARYTGYPVCDNATVGGMPSDWAGAPGGTPTAPSAQLGDGWIKRVVTGLDPFEARVDDFHASPTNTYSSMLVQLGERYEGDIAFNGDPDNLNQIGLIEAYTTVLRRGLALTTQGTPPVDYAPANNQLLLVASRIADFYMLLGNEAFADASDPTVGLGTDSSLGSLAPAIFPFQNQLDSLLSEELTLLRGRDDTGAPTAARPVYNRLFWNFTSGEGEVAYTQAYDVRDQDSNGFIDETDARILFPQGHGDAWGHYLTAITTYYQLLRDPFYTWEPRAESVRVAGVPVLVDFLDERKFAAAAAARARTGSQIVDLVYRREYVEDPTGQWQGYRDTNPERAWGVDEWARRAGQGAYLDWLAANAILPPDDPDFDPGADHPIQRVDRGTVLELDEIPSHYLEIQQQLDDADRGLNPLGLAKGVVPFDIDPSLIDAGLTHFDQIYDRALVAMDNALRVFDYANQLSQALRRNQDTVDDFARNASDRERDFRNRLLEIYGYPYADDIGPAGTYSSGYEGPDIYHYMYVDRSELTGAVAPVPQVTQESFDTYYEPLPGIGFDLPLLGLLDPLQLVGDEVKVVEYQYSLDGSGVFTKPEAWVGQRRAPGEIQNAISDLLQNRARFEAAIEQHDNLVRRIEDTRDLLLARTALDANEIRVLYAKRATNVGLNAVIVAAKAASGTFGAVASKLGEAGKDTAECLPKSVGVATDATAPARCAIRQTFSGLGGLMKAASLVSEGVANGAEAAKEDAAARFEIQLEVASNAFEVLQRVKELEQLIRDEAVLRLEMYTLEEVLRQSAGRYRTVLARGERTLEELVAFRKAAAADIQEYRYQDLAFRVFRNDALQKYRAQLDMCARYTYLAATAYDFETNLLGSAGGAGRRFLTDVVRHRSLGEVIDGVPVAGSRGLADTLARMGQNFDVLRGQLGFNNPQTETNRFSLRSELLRLRDESDEAWRAALQDFRVDDLWSVPEFRRLARPFAPESAGPQPGLVIPFETTVSFGSNFFGWPLGGGDSAYDPSHFATKVRSAGVWFESYDGTGLSNTPRVYLLPAGSDVLRSPNALDFETREWRVVDQKLPVPFPVGSTDLSDPGWIPLHDSLNEDLGGIRQISSFRAYHDSGFFDPAETTTDSRLIGRSVWNTRWLLVVPGGTLLGDAEDGLDGFILGPEVPGGGGVRDGNGISDILLFFQTYSFSGN